MHCAELPQHVIIRYSSPHIPTLSLFSRKRGEYARIVSRRSSAHNAGHLRDLPQLQKKRTGPRCSLSLSCVCCGRLTRTGEREKKKEVNERKGREEKGVHKASRNFEGAHARSSASEALAFFSYLPQRESRVYT